MIYGKRIRLRAIEKDDPQRFVAWLNDPEVRRNMLMYQPLSKAVEELWFADMLKRDQDEHPLVIEVHQGENWQPVGNLGFLNLDQRERSAEIGIFIGEKNLWDKDYGSQAIQLMLKHGCENLKLNRIFLQVYETNERGIRCYEKAGFQHEGRMRQARFQQGRYIDVLLMSVLRDESQPKNQEVKREYYAAAA